MSRPSSHPIGPAVPTATDVLSAISKDDDFGHELRVGAAIRDCPAFVVQHGGTYTDSVTGKPRQFDYRSWLRKEENAREASEVALAVECKNLKPEFPLVVTGLRRTPDEAFIDVVQSTHGHHKHGSKTVAGLSSFTRRLKGEECFYPPKVFVGKSVLRVRLEKGVPNTFGDSDLYEKWAQALASAIALVHNACGKSKTHAVQKFFTAVLPVVVVPDDTLWKVEYSNTGNVIGQPMQVEQCEYFVARGLVAGFDMLQHRFVFSHLHFFTLTGFNAFLSKLALNDHYWRSLFKTGGEIVLL